MATARTTYYHYEPLENHCIRLMRLHPKPRDGTVTGDIEIDLEHKWLGYSKYIALSYTWGATTLEEQDAADLQIFTRVQRCYPIQCQGKIILVTRSLRDALKRMRYILEPTCAADFARQCQGRTLQTELLWADGICIDQENLQERAEQVRHMAEIYALADLTMAYIGELDEHQGRTRRGLELADTLFKISWEFRDSMHLLHTDYVESAKVYALVDAKVPTVEDWMEWAILMSREWFFRTWVLQEAILSGAQDVYIICGGVIVHGERLVRSLEMVIVSRWSQYVTVELQKASRANERYQRYKHKIWDWLNTVHPYLPVLRVWNEEKKVSFYSMSQWQLPQTSCSDPRDKIYSTLGVAAEWEDLDQKLLHVDYQLSVSELFCRATKYVLMRMNCLDILSTVSTRNNTPQSYELPSWCPDYARAAATAKPNVLMGTPSNARILWAASLSSRYVSSRQLESFPTLSLQGTAYEKVKLSHPFDSVLWPCLSPAVLELLLQIIRETHNGKSENVVESFMRCILLYGQYDYSGPDCWETNLEDGLGPTMTYMALLYLQSDLGTNLIPGFDGSTFASDCWVVVEKIAALVKRITDILPETKGHLPCFNVIQKELIRRKGCRDSGADEHEDENTEHYYNLVDSLFPRPEDEIKARRALGEISSVCQGRALFLTDRGRIGIGRDTLQPGDQVWLLAGAKVPLILRERHNGHKELVGETYVDGMMFGELWPSDECTLINVTLE